MNEFLFKYVYKQGLDANHSFYCFDAQWAQGNKGAKEAFKSS
jgi:hypothetical protein